MDIRSGILSAAQTLGVNPLDLATIISYETAGTFNPSIAGPTTQWGQHRGLIQFGEPQARQYGVDWNDPLGSQLGPDGAVVKYFEDRGARPGMGLLDLYSIVNAGGPGLYDRTDANNGGAPGTVRDKVENQMAGHRRKAAKLFGAAGDDTQLGGLAIAPAQQPDLLTEATTMQQEPEQVGGLLGALFPNMSADRADSIRYGLANLGNLSVVGANEGFMRQISDRKADRRQTRKEAAQRNKTADWLRSQGMGQLADGVVSGAISGRDALAMARNAGQQQDPTALMQNIEYIMARNPGMSFQEALQAARGGQTINVDARQVGTIPPGHQVETDETGALRMSPIPGSPAAREVAEADQKANERDRQERLKLGTTLENLNLNIAEIENGGIPVTGLPGAVLGRIPGTPQSDFRNRTEQVTVSAALAEVQNMRDNSPTGGAVGQLTDAEREAIGQAVTSLNNSASADEYLRNARNYRQLMLDLAYGQGKWQLGPDGGVVARGNGNGPPQGITPAEWEAMTPQERALFQ